MSNRKQRAQGGERGQLLEKLRELERAVSRDSLTFAQIHEAESLRNQLGPVLTHTRDRKRWKRAKHRLEKLAFAGYPDLAPGAEPRPPEPAEQPVLATAAALLETPGDSHAADGEAATEPASEPIDGTQAGETRAPLPQHDQARESTSDLRDPSSQLPPKAPTTAVAEPQQPQAWLELRWLLEKSTIGGAEVVNWATTAAALKLALFYTPGTQVSVRRLAVALDNEPIFEACPWIEEANEPTQSALARFDLEVPRRALAARSCFRRLTAIAQIGVGREVLDLRCWIEMAWQGSRGTGVGDVVLTPGNDGFREVSL